MMINFGLLDSCGFMNEWIYASYDMNKSLFEKELSYGRIIYRMGMDEWAWTSGRVDEWAWTLILSEEENPP